MNGQLFSIQTKDRNRAELWQRLFDLDALPVVTNRARWQDINGGRAGDNGPPGAAGTGGGVGGGMRDEG